MYIYDERQGMREHIIESSSLCEYEYLRQKESRSIKVRTQQWLMGRTATHNSENDAS